MDFSLRHHMNWHFGTTWLRGTVLTFADGNPWHVSSQLGILGWLPQSFWFRMWMCMKPCRQINLSPGERVQSHHLRFVAKDKSPLENMHCSKMFELVGQARCIWACEIQTLKTQVNLKFEPGTLALFVEVTFSRHCQRHNTTKCGRSVLKRSFTRTTPSIFPWSRMCKCCTRRSGGKSTITKCTLLPLDGWISMWRCCAACMRCVRTRMHSHALTCTHRHRRTVLCILCILCPQSYGIMGGIGSKCPMFRYFLYCFMICWMI